MTLLLGQNCLVRTRPCLIQTRELKNSGSMDSMSFMVSFLFNILQVKTISVIPVFRIRTDLAGSAWQNGSGSRQRLKNVFFLFCSLTEILTLQRWKSQGIKIHGLGYRYRFSIDFHIHNLGYGWQTSQDFWFADFFLDICKIHQLVWIFLWIFGCFESIYKCFV